MRTSHYLEAEEETASDYYEISTSSYSPIIRANTYASKMTALMKWTAVREPNGMRSLIMDLHNNIYVVEYRES